jgi:hypothetical protein
MSNATPASKRAEDLETVPGPNSAAHRDQYTSAHRGVVLTGQDGEDGPKAFYIHVQAQPGKENLVIEMLNDIFNCVMDEPATGPWFGVRYSKATFGIFEAFPSIAGRDAHVAGGGGDIFRSIERMNHLLSEPAHVYRLDILFSKKVFA